MKVVIPQLNLAAMIARGGAVAPKNSPIPILQHCRLIAKDGNLSLATSDMDRFAEATSAAEIVVEGSCTVDTAAFTKLISKHPKVAAITLEMEGMGHLIVTCGRSKVKLPTRNPADFPVWADEPAISEFEMQGEDFERAFNRVRFAVSSDSTRYYLQGVYLDYRDNCLHFVATDGHRLALSGIEAPAGAEECPKVIVATETVNAALDVFKGVASVNVAINKRAASFAANGLRLAGKLIDGVFPDYTRVVPAKGAKKMSFRRVDFVDCLERANVLTGEGAFSSIVARPHGDDTLALEARSPQRGEAIEELNAIVEEGYRPFGFNPRYAAQFLSMLTVAELTIEQTDPDGPHLLYSDDAPDFLGVLMPMRVAA